MLRQHFASLHLHSTPSFFIRLYRLRRRLSASSRALHTTADAGSLRTLRRHTPLHFASHFESHHTSHRTAPHFNAPRTSHIYNSSHSTPASLFAPAGGGFNAFRRRASTRSKRLRKPRELQPTPPHHFSYPRMFRVRGNVTAKCCIVSPPFIIRQSSLMDLAGTTSPDRADANISLFWVSPRVYRDIQSEMCDMAKM